MNKHAEMRLHIKFFSKHASCACLSKKKVEEVDY